MLLLSSFLAFVAYAGITEIQQVVKCADYACDENTSYEDHGGNPYKKKCPEDPTNLFWKPEGYIKEGQLEPFCKANGYDGAGRTWASLQGHVLWVYRKFDSSINACNVAYELHNILDDFKEKYYWPITFECVNYEDAPADCCTNWTGECYNRRNAKNKFHACMMCARDDSPKGPCTSACGGGDTQGKAGSKQESDECRECCQTQEHATDWRCDEVPAPMTEDEAKIACGLNNDSKRSCKNAIPSDVGKCKFKKKKDGNLCKLKFFYGACDTLARKGCKKMVKKGKCKSNDNYKTCQDAD